MNDGTILKRQGRAGRNGLAAKRIGIDATTNEAEARCYAATLEAEGRGANGAARGFYILRLRSAADERVHERLTDEGLEVWRPMSTRKVRIQHTTKFKPAEHPALPGYLFVAVADVQTCYHALAALRDVLGVVGGADGRPFVATRKLVDRWKARLDGALAKATGHLPERSLNPGDRVQVVDGIAAGLDAVVEALVNGRGGVEEVQVAFNGLASGKKFTLPLASVKKSG